MVENQEDKVVFGKYNNEEHVDEWSLGLCVCAFGIFSYIGYMDHRFLWGYLFAAIGLIALAVIPALVGKIITKILRLK